ncbi:uncharacterized protein LOC112093571 [Morus notabilis]|uniref:uncharacterized protein LOC112093571 n=1 Tax=Morus notabilis TaxID=981085 RepID=UPI000CED3D02|nr:uncharacterized protein LOC112093571 [Morus notabilis]
MEVEKNMASFLNLNSNLIDSMIAYVIDPKLEPFSEPKEDDSDELKAVRKKREDDEVMCRGHILNTLSDRLYDLYNSMESPVEIWNALEYKYKTEKEVGAIIAKLPQSCNGYRKKLLHRRNDITLKELQKHLRIEEETKSRDPNGKIIDFSKVKVAEASHYQNDCRYKKKKEEVNTNKANTVEEKSEDICAMVSEMQIDMIIAPNMAATKFSEWWLDSSATIDVCNDKKLFSSYKVEKEGQTVLMGNNDASMVAGRGVVEINFTFGKKLILNNVLHVPDIRKNLVYASLMCKNGLQIILEGNNCIVSKNEEIEMVYLIKIPLLLNVEEDPKTFSEAMSSKDASFWRKAVNDEMNSIMSNQT